ncbi:MAG: sensor histidine kinase [Kofleriaceae bacterium]
MDDELSNRVVFEQSMGDLFRIKTVGSGAAALELLDGSEDIAVLVTDMRMPGMSGEDLLRIVRERSPQTIRMVITAYADVDPILRAINEGLVARYIIKPWEVAELVQVLRWATEAWMFSRDSAALSQRLLETERLVMLGSMLGAVSHDMKQPLAALALHTAPLEELVRAVPIIRRLVSGEALSEDESAWLMGFAGELEELVQIVRSSVHHMQELTENLGQFLRTTAADDSDPLPIVRHAMAVCRELSLVAQSDLVYEGAQFLPRIHMPSIALTQVLINVLTNALQAILARARPGGRVVVSTARQGQMLVFEIRDDGVGMTPDVLARVGTPFFTTRSDGTGLGVSQCQRLVGAAGGRFMITSDPARGTTVTISLPLLNP